MLQYLRSLNEQVTECVIQLAGLCNCMYYLSLQCIERFYEKMLSVPKYMLDDVHMIVLCQ